MGNGGYLTNRRTSEISDDKDAETPTPDTNEGSEDAKADSEQSAEGEGEATPPAPDATSKPTQSTEEDKPVPTPPAKPTEDESAVNDSPEPQPTIEQKVPVDSVRKSPEASPGSSTGTIFMFVVVAAVILFVCRRFRRQPAESTTAYSPVPVSEYAAAESARQQPDEDSSDFEDDFDMEEGHGTSRGLQMGKISPSTSSQAARLSKSQIRDEWDDEVSGDVTSDWRDEDEDIAFNRPVTGTIPAIPSPLVRSGSGSVSSVAPPPRPMHGSRSQGSLPLTREGSPSLTPHSTLQTSSTNGSRSNTSRSRSRPPQSLPADDIFATIGIEAAPTFRKAVPLPPPEAKVESKPESPIRSALRDVNLDDVVTGGDWGDDCDLSGDD